MIDAAIDKAKSIPRNVALQRVAKKQNDRVIFVLDFNPILPSMSAIIKSSWRVMTQDPYMKKVYPQPPMIAFRRPPNLKNKLVKSKVPDPPPRHPVRLRMGVKRYNTNNYSICPYVKVGTEAKVKINISGNCDTVNLIYCITCK